MGLVTHLIYEPLKSSKSSEIGPSLRFGRETVTQKNFIEGCYVNIQKEYPIYSDYSFHQTIPVTVSCNNFTTS